MAEPTTVEEVVVTGKRKKPNFVARAARTARFSVKDPGALIEGARTLPGALVRAARNYAATHTPGEAASDAMRVGKGMFQDVVEHPIQTVAGALPFVGAAMSAYDTAKAREAAADARARGDERTAKAYEQIAAGTGAAILAGMLPLGRTVGKGLLKEGEEAALREARKGALREAEKLATKYGLDEFITDLTPEQRAANRAAYPTPAYHGTPRSYGNEGAFTAFQDQNLGDEYMLDRRLGTHFARDPEVSNSFTHADWDKGTAALPGSHVLPVQLPPEHELLTVEQPLIPWTDPNSPDYRPMPNPGEVREPLHKTDQRAIEELIAVEAYKRDPELLARYLVQARAVAPEDASLLAKQLVAGHEVVLPHDGPTNLKSFVGNFGGNPYNDADRAQMVTLAREALRERGYKGLRYINTSKRETAGAADPTSYIIFDPKHVKSRFNRGTYDPNDPHLNKARGGLVAKYRR